MVQVFEDHQDSIHNIAAFANKKFEAFEEFSGQVLHNSMSDMRNKQTIGRSLSQWRSSLGFWKRRYQTEKMQTSADFIKIVGQLI